jgi:UDP-2-acetamido-3-amino-2,3-dideoxy-glucuronate N-acetyltransferase
LEIFTGRITIFPNHPEKQKLMIDVAQIGLGRWGLNILRNLCELKESCSVRYACDLDPAALKRARRLFPDLNFVRTYRKILKDNLVKGVLVASPAETHFKIVRDCLLAGKHVFVEKPITLCSWQARQLVTLAKRKHLKLMVGHLLVYHPATSEIVRLLKKKILGKILFFCFRRTNLGVFRKTEDVLWDASVHDLASLLFLTGEKLPALVTAVGQTSFRRNIAEVVSTTLTFKNGLKAFLFGSWLDPFKLRQTIIVGEEGMLVLDEHDRESKLKLYKKRVVYDRKKKDFKYLDDGVEFMAVPAEEPLKLECGHFLNALTGGKILTGGEVGYKVLKILEAAGQSLKANGRIVKIAE